MSGEAEKERRFATLIAALSNGSARLRAMRDDGTVAFDASTFVLALIKANGGWYEPDEDRASLFLSRGRKAAREVGELVHAAHGFSGMQAVHEMIATILPRGAARELEMAWDGIGEWRA